MLKKLIIVLAILILLTACQKDKEKEKTYGDVLLGALDRGKMEKTKADMEALGGALNSYLIDNNSYPLSTDIIELSSWLSPAYIVLVPTHDGWGNKFIYTSDGHSYQLTAVGKDFKKDTADDIVYSDGKFTKLPRIR
jgi:hypothetical protein